jgi:hypothetical protein
MKNSDQVEQGGMRSVADTQEGLTALEEWDTHFNTSKHYAPRFGSKIAKENNGIVKLLFLATGILIVIYWVTVFF